MNPKHNMAPTAPINLEQSQVLVDALVHQPGVTEVPVPLSSEDTFSFSPDTDMSSGTVNERQAVAQDLRGVIKAGDELFGIVKANVTDDKTGKPLEHFLLTHFGDEETGQRATIVGVLGATPLFVGRTAKNGYSDTTSRKHFGIALVDAQIKIGDEGSSNGTKLYFAEAAGQQQAPESPKFGLSALHKALRAKKAPESVEENPMDKFQLWSPKSSDVKEQIMAAYGPAPTASEKSPLEWNPQDIGAIIDRSSKDGQVKISDILKESADKAATLSLQTGSGRITLEKSTEDGLFRVSESADASMKPGDRIALDGTTLSGVGVRPGVLTANTRLGFRKQKSIVLEFGNEDNEKTITQATFKYYQEEMPHMVSQLPDGKIEYRYFDPSIRATDFIAHAELTTISDSGVESKKLF